MARTSTYLNFDGRTEEAFRFYASAFGTEPFGTPMRMGDVPAGPGMPELTADEKRKIMHVALPILGGHVLMGTDILPSMGHTLTFGNNVSINLEPDTREETKRLYDALAKGGERSTELQEMFWGGYFGSLVDPFGVRWMFNCEEKP